MRSDLKGIKILAIAASVPDRWVSLDEQFAYEGSVIEEKTLKRRKKSTGIEGRYVSNNKQTNSDWCFAAAEKILSELSIDRNRVGVVVYVTQTADYQQPATALVLQHRLGIGDNCIVFDINLGCSGYVYGLNVVSSLLMTSNAEYGLLMCGETASRPKRFDVDDDSEVDDMIFGDAGSATLLTKDHDTGNMCFLSKSDGSRFRTLIHPWEFYRNPIRMGKNSVMDGIDVFNFSTQEVPELIKELMVEMKTTPDDYDYIILHQANKLIMQRIEKKTGFYEEKSLKSIAEFANTSSASIPLTIVHNLVGQDLKTYRVLMCGYGIGLSWSVVDCYLDKTVIIPLVKTSEYFEDGFQNVN